MTNNLAIVDYLMHSVRKFNPDQPRDDHGRFGEGSGTTTTIIGKPSARMERAVNSAVRTGKKEQDIADRSEKVLSNVLGIPRTADNSAFDVRNNRVGIEVKTLVNGKNEKITMSKSALARKLNEQKRDKLKGYTVVVDRRSGGMSGRATYYVKEGFGSFRVSNMQKVTLSELKAMVKR